MKDLPLTLASPGRHDREAVGPRWRVSGDRGAFSAQAAADRRAPLTRWCVARGGCSGSIVLKFRIISSDKSADLGASSRRSARHARRGAVRGHVPAGRRPGRVRRVQPRLARCPPRALTRWCVARGEGAARCAGRPCRSVGRHAASPVRAAPDRRRVGRRPRAVPVR